MSTNPEECGECGGLLPGHKVTCSKKPPTVGDPRPWDPPWPPPGSGGDG